MLLPVLDRERATKKHIAIMHVLTPIKVIGNSDLVPVADSEVKLIVFGAQQRYSFFGAALFAHRLATHFDAVSVVHQAVENAVSQRRIINLLMPVRYGQLAAQDLRPLLLAILTDLHDVAALGIRQGRHGPVVNYQDLQPS